MPRWVPMLPVLLLALRAAGAIATASPPSSHSSEPPAGAKSLEDLLGLWRASWWTSGLARAKRAVRDPAAFGTTATFTSPPNRNRTTRGGKVSYPNVRPAGSNESAGVDFLVGDFFSSEGGAASGEDQPLFAGWPPTDVVVSMPSSENGEEEHARFDPGGGSDVPGGAGEEAAEEEREDVAVLSSRPPEGAAKDTTAVILPVVLVAAAVLVLILAAAACFSATVRVSPTVTRCRDFLAWTARRLAPHCFALATPATRRSPGTPEGEEADKGAVACRTEGHGVGDGDLEMAVQIPVVSASPSEHFDPSSARTCPDVAPTPDEDRCATTAREQLLALRARLSPRLEVTSSQLSFGAVVGEGAFGTVYRGTMFNIPVAIKKLHGAGSLVSAGAERALSAEFTRELSVLIALDCPADSRTGHRPVVTFFAACFDPACLVMELVNGPGGATLEEHLSPERTLRIARQVAAGCAYLHSVPPSGIVHRDLKSQNILIDRRYNAKVTDFGCSKLRRTLGTVMSTDRGTINWSAPEVLRGTSDYTAACDVYSYGLVLCEMLTNKIPYEEMHMYAIINRVGMGGERPELPDRPSSAALGAGWDRDRPSRSGDSGDSGGGEDEADGGKIRNRMPSGDESGSGAWRGTTLRGSLSRAARACWTQTPKDRPDFEEVAAFLDALDAPPKGEARRE